MKLKQGVMLLAVFTVLVLIIFLIGFWTDVSRTTVQLLGPIAGCVIHSC